MLRASFVLPEEEEGLSFYCVEGKCVQQCSLHVEYIGQKNICLKLGLFWSETKSLTLGLITINKLT